MVTNLSREKASRNILASCFYDPNTVLNTNGTFVRVVRLSNFRFSTALMSRVRSACKKVLYSKGHSCAAIWISTVRSSVQANRLRKIPTDGFAVGFSKAYGRSVDEEDKFSNEVFISVVSNSVLECMAGFTDFLLSSLLKRFNKAAADVVNNSLENAVKAFFTELAEYNPTLLTENELLNFLNTLLGSEQKKMESGLSDISSELLSEKKIFFGFNTFEIHNRSKKRTFGTSFSVKSFHNLTDFQCVSKFLGMQQRLIVTEVISRETQEGLKDAFEESLALAVVVNDDEYQKLSSKAAIAAHMKEKKLEEFCRRSLKVTLFSDSIEQLNSATIDCEKIFSQSGFMLVRDDLLLQDTFWGNLPGAFSRMRKWETVLFKDACCFSFTHSHFRSISDDMSRYFTKFIAFGGVTHYFAFSQARGDGHAVIFGKEDSSKIELQNFLLLEAYVTLGAEFLIFDDQYLSEIFVRAVEGSYLEMGAEFRCNILDISDKILLRVVLESFCCGKVDGKTLGNVVERLSEVSPAERNLLHCAEYLEPILGDLSILKEKYGHLFDEQFDSSCLLEKKLAVSFRKSLSSSKSISPVVAYIMAKYIELRTLSEKPFIIVVQDPIRFKRLFPSLGGCELFFQAVSERGGLIMFSSETTTFLRELGEVGKKYITTKMLVPLNEDLTVEQSKLFSLSSSFMRKLDSASLLGRCFFLKQGSEMITLKFDLSSFDEAVVLSSRGKIKKARSIIQQSGDNPAIWLPLFCKECK